MPHTTWHDLVFLTRQETGFILCPVPTVYPRGVICSDCADMYLNVNKIHEPSVPRTAFLLVLLYVPMGNKSEHSG